MFDPMPDTGESEHDRLKRFVKAILSVPKAEVPTVKKAVADLESEKRKIDTQLEVVQREIAKREGTPRKRS
jgi:CO dehydrogenase/acetyl-CoA synthase beta subunit